MSHFPSNSIKCKTFRRGTYSENDKRIYTNKKPVYKKRGECVTFKASHYFSLKPGASYAWYKYAVQLPQGTTNTTTVSKNTLSIRNVLPRDTAQYQAEVDTKGGREVTRYWLTVKGCEINERETTFSDCKVACEGRTVCISIEMCLKDWSYFNGKCFRYFSEPKTWEEAHGFCQGNGAKLATIDNQEENE
ncbi:predicted protein [Nematostella vectensis]|uniref:Immunoglobulin domain-containing protein n=1 Tax=Nematostella vectensis TaxID=45351 RepID=A7T4Q2_NEMVE|nr:predicted protein [Nematostella vectensis]|eukprot:XP_001621162.1 hypothetical protein NEMVEDRAFT_v1g222305 [Nematostella vectensis]